MQHRSISDTQAGRQIWSVKDRPHLFHGEVLNQGLIMSLRWNRADLMRLLKARRCPQFDVSHEGFDCRKARVTCNGGV
jgi:hypothetical protein